MTKKGVARMKKPGMWSFVLSLLLIMASSISHADLLSYLQKSDDSFQWNLEKSSKQADGGEIYEFHMTSQTWEGIPWQHRIALFVPANDIYPDSCTLLITGGNMGIEETIIGQAVAKATGAPLAILFNIPNQPLFDGKNEDALIAYTFEQYLKTGDENWPLLFPMVKSAIRAMDVLQDYSKQHMSKPFNRFIIAGASKRGWTTWLTGASGDKRIYGIMPMVIDNLNMAAQMPHQLEAWGHYSAEIEDYTRLGIQQQMTTDRGKQLVKLVDPWTYRKTLTMPKLIINGTNDPYWTQDALNLYWNGLPEPKWVLYIANSGHGLDNKELLVRAAIAFVKSIFSGKMPEQPHWTWTKTDNGAKLEVTAKTATGAAWLWSTTAPNQDFRKSRWQSAPMSGENGTYTITIPNPASGFEAAYGMVELKVGDKTLPVTTQIQILGAGAK
jgi:PhoPQ-activated pathogenicity-related protein